MNESDDDEVAVTELLDTTIGTICNKLDEENREEFGFRVDFKDMQLSVFISLRKHEAIQ